LDNLAVDPSNLTAQKILRSGGVRRKLIDFIGNFQAFDASTLQFHLPDKTKLAESINLSERAQEMGRHNLPKEADDEKDHLAQEIDGHMYAVIRQAKSHVDHHIHASLEMFQTNSIVGDTNDEHIIFKETMNKLHESAKLAVVDLFTSRRNLIDFEKFFRIFRDDNNLLRPAIYPDSLLRAWGVVFFFAMIETFVNAFTLKDVHPEGFSGVLTETLGFTGVNMALAICAGIVMRKKNLVHTTHRAMGYIVPLLIVLGIISLNLFFGHYRDALSSVGHSAELSVATMSEQYGVLGREAAFRLSNDPFSLTDFKSYLLIFIGITMGVFAIYKSYVNDDIYPEYGKFDRELSALAEEYHFFMEDLYADLCNIVEVGIKKLQASGTYRKQALEQINGRIERLKSLESNYKLWFVNMEAIGNSLYGEYRTESLKYRSDGGNPKCFRIKFSVPIEAKVEFERMERRAVNLPPIDKRAEKLQDALKSYMDHFKAIENLSPDELVLKEFDFKETKVDKIASKFKVSGG
jgi:hypothetical protein